MKTRRKLDWTDWLIIAILWLLVPLCALWVALGSAGIGRILESTTWASWAQAGFSAAAVFAAIGVVWWQIVHGQNERRRDEAQKLENLGISLFFFRVVAYELDLHLGENKSGSVQWTSLQHHVKEFWSLSIYETPSPMAVFQVARVRTGFTTLETIWIGTAGDENRSQLRQVALRVLLAWTFEAEVAIRQLTIDRKWKPTPLSQPVSGGKLAHYGSTELTADQGARQVFGSRPP